MTTKARRCVLARVPVELEVVVLVGLLTLCYAFVWLRGLWREGRAQATLGYMAWKSRISKLNGIKE